MEESLAKNARDYAILRHEEVNHLYDGQPYSYHLIKVVNIASEFIYLVDRGMEERVLAACWCHDLIEDARVTYNDLRNKIHTDVADIVYAVTNEKGKTRSERANDKYYGALRANYHAIYVKCCDRIANIEYSIVMKSDMYQVYLKEHQYFFKMLFHPSFKPLFDRLQKLIEHGR